MKLLLTLLFSTFSLVSIHKHPIYVTNTEIEYDFNSKQFEIAIKIFSDDLEKVLSEKHRKVIEIGTEREDKNATDYIIDYIKDNFTLTLNNKQKELVFVNRKHVREDFYAMWLLFVVPKVKNIRTFTIENTLLLNTFDTQRNFISYKNGNSFKKYYTDKTIQVVDLAK